MLVFDQVSYLPVAPPRDFQDLRWADRAGIQVLGHSQVAALRPRGHRRFGASESSAELLVMNSGERAWVVGRVDLVCWVAQWHGRSVETRVQAHLSG